MFLRRHACAGRQDIQLPDPGMQYLISVYDLGGAIIGAVVDNDYLIVRIVLIQEMLKEILNRLFLIAGRHDNGNRRFPDLSREAESSHPEGEAKNDGTIENSRTHQGYFDSGGEGHRHDDRE